MMVAEFVISVVALFAIFVLVVIFWARGDSNRKDEDPETESELRHVCGLQGFCRGLGSMHDTCPACEAHYERTKNE